MDLVKPSQLTEKARLKRELVNAAQADLSAHMACLVSQPGYSYARTIASGIAKEFECKPNDPNWHTYSTVKWALDKLFIGIENLAGHEPKESKPNGNNRRNRK